jgi:hypothetical protein
MTALAQQQEALLQALFDWPAQDAINNLAIYAMDTGARGLKAYQANGHALAKRALEAAYPVLLQMVGHESFADLARALWHAHPPHAGDAARWGDALADFIERDPQLLQHPYLADVARCEWLLHRAAFAGDASADHSTLGLLTTSDPAALGLALAPGAAWLESHWPLAGLIGSHTAGTPSLVEVAEMLRTAVRQNVVVWRNGLKPDVREALPGEIALLSSLAQGRSLLAALETAESLDFAQWLPLAAQSGLVLRVFALPVT